MSHKELFEIYLQEISKNYIHLETSEMGYRTDFENLLRGLFKEIGITDIRHDAKADNGNKPDFIVVKNEIPVLYIEVKDIGVSLDKVEISEQMTRYYGYDNLILTDYLEFRFYRNGLRYSEPISIANYNKKNRTIAIKPENFELLAKTLIEFPQSHKEPIKSGVHLAKVMGGKALRIRENVKELFTKPDHEQLGVYKVFESMKRTLIHDMNTESFADMYAQTLVYGLFVARYHDESQDSFTRQEARELVPASNPLLRHFFDHIVGADFDKSRLNFIVNELCEIFAHADVPKLMSNYYKNEKTSKDPVIHFYEDFLQEYDSEKRKSFGAYYTPLPVVQFIVRSVDKILEQDFGLGGGLANASKECAEHKVQILDPATGTGTFLTEVIKHIHGKFANQTGRWGTYVHHDLLPRLFGFELMMAPYTIAHLKMSMLLQETGFKYFNNTRLGIYLTNSLEEGDSVGDLFGNFGLAESISQESKEAVKIKNDKPIMVVIGNPPYSVSSQNRGKWILNLIKDYKKDLHERKINLDDDYIKFIRFAEHFIEKNQTGVVAMITNNSFIDGITHRQMRKHLLETFDNIYILDLHGNSKKKEKALDGSKDENVFDIQQGVSINIFVRKNKVKEGLGKVHHAEIYGLRQGKFQYLDQNDILSIAWNDLEYFEPNYFFTLKDFSESKDYNKGFRVDEILEVFNSGIQTKNDGLAISTNKDLLIKTTEDFTNLTIIELKNKYSDRDESSGWNFESAKSDIAKGFSIVKYHYRPLDFKYLVYTGRSSGFIGRSRSITSKHFLKENIGFALMKQVFQEGSYSHIVATNSMIDERTNYSNRGGTYLFPLYLYEQGNVKTPNLNTKIVAQIEQTIGSVKPEEIFDYIYATLHSPNYREKFKEFLKIDFPRIPYPKDRKKFDELVVLGGELRKYHLLEHGSINPFEIAYMGEGENEVMKPEYKNERIYINSEQYFGNISEIAWNFYIGGYQPAQKWLKDRKGRKLMNDEIEHYQKILISLRETDRLMKEIDNLF